jgi:hypothetical protein
MKLSEAKFVAVHFILMIVAVVLFSNKGLEIPLFIRQLAISFVCGTFLFLLIWFKVCGEDFFEKFFAVFLYLVAASPLILTYIYDSPAQWIAVGAGYFIAGVITYFSALNFKD